MEPGERVAFASFEYAPGSYQSVMHWRGEAWSVASLLKAIGGYDSSAAVRATPLDVIFAAARPFQETMKLLLQEADARGTSVHRLNGSGRPVAPLLRPGKILALGRTYRAHSEELGNVALDEPLLFEKLPDCLSGSGDEVWVERMTEGGLEHEAELAVVIGREAFQLADGEGPGAIAGYTIANDLTLRVIQKAAQRAGHPWLLAKNFPGSCALGPYLIPASCSGDPDRLSITCTVNGKIRQEESTAALSRPVGALIEWISRRLRLHPGDIVSTGTPAGTGKLVPGDSCEVRIRGTDVDFGVLKTRVGSRA